jgi:hypothetical protein
LPLLSDSSTNVGGEVEIEDPVSLAYF